MVDIERLKRLIEPHKNTDREFFLNLLDGEAQCALEQERLSAVMLMLKAVYINALKNTVKEMKEERHRLNSLQGHGAEEYRRVLELNAAINERTKKINSYKPFFDETYFARMDVVDEREGYNSYYIGKHGDEKLEIVDWRAPLARRYYQKSLTAFTINDYSYRLILRRALRTRSGRLLDMRNEYLSVSGYLTEEEIGGREEEIVFDPFLKEILKSRKEKSEICDIIETIQEQQYSMITMPERGEFVLQGVAGSGKTMVLLHRLSYILYDNQSLSPGDMLVITPSDSFNDFIDELAAVLELEKVQTITLESYFLTLLKRAGVDIEDRTDFTRPVPEKLAEYIYSERFVADVRKKLGKIFDGVHGMFTGEECAHISKDIAAACRRQEAEYDSIKNASLRVRRCVLGEIKEKPDGGLYYTKLFRNMFNCVSDVREFFEIAFTDSRMEEYAYFYKQLLSFYKSLKFLSRRAADICGGAQRDLDVLKSVMEREIFDLCRYKTVTGGRESYTYPERIARREQAIEEIVAVKGAISRISDDFAPLFDFADVVRGESYFTAIGRCENAYDIARFFYRETVRPAKESAGFPSKKLCRFAPFALCLILTELGFPLSPRYGFVFVDEGQDISPAEYSVLRAVNKDAAFNVFGDLKQNITPFRGISDWRALGLEVYDFRLNYRNTNEIVEYVSGNLGIDMQSIGLGGEEVVRIEARSAGRFLSDKKGLRAIICTERSFPSLVRKSYNVLRETGRLSKSRINFMTVYESKGLEFSAVAVADGDMSDNERYIAYTRALKYLAIIR